MFHRPREGALAAEGYGNTPPQGAVPREIGVADSPVLLGHTLLWRPCLGKINLKSGL